MIKKCGKKFNKNNLKSNREMNGTVEDFHSLLERLCGEEACEGCGCGQRLAKVKKNVH